MTRLPFTALVWLGLMYAPASADTDLKLRQPWDAPYTADDAAGQHVIALWSFDDEDALKDVSGHGHDLKLSGAKLAKDGRFGGGLESFRGHPVEDKRHAARAKDHPALSPEGAFTIEMWIQPKKEIEDYPASFLLDKKYVANDDYQLVLSDTNRSGTRTLSMNLGFGKDSDSFHARPYAFTPGEWVHVAFTYDGAGTGRFFLNGKPWGKTVRAGRKSIHAGRHPLSIGDRIGSYYHGFPGRLDQVRICKGVLEFSRAKLAMQRRRTVFVRAEAPPIFTARVTNLQREPLSGATLTASIDEMALTRASLPDIPPGKTHAVECRLDTKLRPDAYRLVTSVSFAEEASGEIEESFPLQIVPRKPPHQFPVLMWGVYNPAGVEKEMPRLKRIGFTHVLGFGADYQKIWDAGEPTGAGDAEAVAATREMLDKALAGGLSIGSSLSPGRFAKKLEQYLRVNRQGEPYKDENICGLFPRIIEFCRNVGVSVGRTYGDHPAFQAVLAHTEIRDHARPCFHDHDRKAYRARAGADIPDEVRSKWGVSWEKIEGFPADRVIPDDHPILRYLRWYWKEGDGWNGLNTALCEGLNDGGAEGVWTWFDPAARVASVYGSGGKVDVLSHWTYTYPDPTRIAVATEELFAMARGARPPQDVMKMTQIIWYRSQTAPMPKAGEEDAGRHRARWEREQPDAPFITIPPMHLREAFWTKIARPIRGIMYHGWQSLVPCPPGSSYRYTNPQTKRELARLIDEIVRPLGPTLLQVPGVKNDVAFLESFASQMFAHRGTYGWGKSWIADAFLVTLYAHLQPDIVYDETITDGGLDGYRVLVMTHCDVLTESVANKVKAFQKRGGIVVADKHLAPAVTPDIRIEPLARSGKAKADKQALLARAADLRKQLHEKYTRYADTTAPEMIPYRRRYAGTDYVFLVNDRREFGNYVGHHGKVMEIGLQTTGVVHLRRKTGHVYDLVTHQHVPAAEKAGELHVNRTLGPCDGTLLMVTPQPIGRLKLDVPKEARRGTSVECRVDVLTSDGTPIAAVVPVEVRIRDPEGREAEFSGFYGAKDGKVGIRLDIAPNDLCGTWQVDARDLASGRRATAYFRVVR